MDRSKGDLVVFKDNRKLVIEMTDLGGSISKKNKYSNRSHIRDFLIGKIVRIITSNECKTIFVFNNQAAKSAINEDFKRIINKFKVNIVFTDFKKNWAIDVAKKINTSFKIK